jgi:hypothetical protein
MSGDEDPMIGRTRAGAGHVAGSGPAVMVATLIAISRGVLRENEAIKAEAGHSAERTTLSMARNVQVLPLLAVIVTVLLMTVGTLGLVFVTIPALIFLCHVTIVQLILFCGCFIVLQALMGDKKEETTRWLALDLEVSKKATNAAVFAVLKTLQTIVCCCGVCCGGYFSDGATIMGQNAADLEGMKFFLPHVICGLQVTQGLGIIAWAVYEGMSFGTITKLYFGAFVLPPFNWNLDFSIYFDLSLWSRLFMLNLGEFELFGASITLQLITMGFALLRRALAARSTHAHIKRDGGYVRTGVRALERWRDGDYYIEMVEPPTNSNGD